MRDAAKYPIMHIADPTKQSYLAQSVSSTEVVNFNVENIDSILKMLKT